MIPFSTLTVSAGSPCTLHSRSSTGFDSTEARLKDALAGISSLWQAAHQAGSNWLRYDPAAAAAAAAAVTAAAVAAAAADITAC
jgi:hypothetical protein